MSSLKFFYVEFGHKLTSSKVSSSKIKQFLASTFGVGIILADGLSVIFSTISLSLASGFLSVASVLLFSFSKWRFSISLTSILLRTEAISISGLALREILNNGHESCHMLFD